ncbi:hypothetical protein CHLRE_11g480250v5 [Chlamydomonas reinhardtii]|uniref:Fungal lipase-type domain-containing protein n=1 Tax=Chlamydomonas reinhardtii TaxID=3055 RepID=A0A2K3D8M6_CHLRE|nr:uncharacterized protein CHLRE_11g480250v5 [Chlamydomonas reinhardtii]XP_042919722.1 uncharacterized protein CHLRE_11g480250v5 [Chlamydomonas reinhardtii]PNW76890.1 hypothetical protein CHLRE_11g480250v5 [Chlamydomonas reinhardtii]PNW76891.1 hypothetical protein CHLRE_11g480250v5 [Chlamydomonas reinhardtii]
MTASRRVGPFCVSTALVCALALVVSRASATQSTRSLKQSTSAVGVATPSPTPFTAGPCPCKEGDGLVCVNKTCQCRSGTTYCGANDGCVNLSKDNDMHCGACNNKCTGGAKCRNGKCVCPKGKVRCGAGCVAVASFQRDERNCGGCGTVCGTGQTCDTGICVCPDLPASSNGGTRLQQFWDDDLKTCVALRPGECKGGFLTAAGGFNRSGNVPYPSQPQNTLFAFLTAASYDWFWGLSPKTPDKAFTACMQRWGIVAPPVVKNYRVKPAQQGSTTPAVTYTTIVMRTATDVFVLLRGDENRASWLAPLSAQTESAGEWFTMDTRLQVDMKAAFSATDVDLLRAVRKAYTEVGVKPAGAAAGGGNTSRIYVAGHGMGAGVAAIAALRLITALGVRGPFMGGVYLFNAPRVGNDVWRNGYNNLLGPRTLHYRIARDYFPVPPLSAGLRDVGNTVMFCPNMLVAPYNASQDAHSSLAVNCQIGPESWAPSNTALFLPSAAYDILQARIGTPCILKASQSCNMVPNCQASDKPTKGTNDTYSMHCLGCFEDSDCAALGYPVAFCDNFRSDSPSACHIAVPNGRACDLDRDCSSGHCVTGVCRQCDEDNHCVSGTFCEAPLSGPSVNPLRPDLLYSCRTAFRRGEACGRDRQCRSDRCNSTMTTPTCL